MQKNNIYIILFFIPFIAGIVFLFQVNVDKKFSYQFVKGECENKASWLYNRIFENNKPIDIAFSGASHIACGIMDKFIEQELNKKLNKNIHVTNLGYCRGGRDLQYVMLQDLFEHKNPKMLFVVVAEDEAKKGHPVFPYLAESRDLFGSHIFFNPYYFSNLWKGLTTRFEYIKFKAFKNSYAEYNFPAYGYFPGPMQADSVLLKENIKVWQYRLQHQNPLFIRRIETNYSKYYLKKIVDLAKTNNCELRFLYLPESGSRLQQPLLMDFYKDLAETVFVPNSIIINRKNWKDAAHLNDNGAKETSEYLAKFILETF